MFVGILVTTLEIVQHEQSATQKKLQYAKSATEEESKTKTQERGKVQHEIEQYIKIVQHEKKLQHEKIATQKMTKQKLCSMKKVQHEKI